MTDCFNSILVRLKVEETYTQLNKGMFCFNSILVRLKATKTSVVVSISTVSIPYWFD